MSMEFVVRYLPPGAAAVLQETLSADSADTLRTRLSAEGHVVLEIQPAQRLGPLWQPRRPRLDVAWWCRELETLLRAGMTVVEALETLSGGERDAARDSVHARMLESLHQGQSLSAAMRQVGVFPSVLVAGVTASERTSTLPDALQEYLRYDELMQGLKRQALSAALYPTIVVGLGALITVFLLVYVIPRFSRMYGDEWQGLSTATQMVLGLSHVLREYGGMMLMVLFATVVAAVVILRSDRGRALWARARAGVPGLRVVEGHFSRAKLFHSLALLMRGGYNLDEAIQVCQGLELGASSREALQLARGHIARGRAASQAFAAAGLTDATAERLLRVGERTGSFDNVLQVVAERHAQAFATFVQRATRLLEPVLLLVVAVVVGGIVVMMYMPIFDMAGGLGAAR